MKKSILVVGPPLIEGRGVFVVFWSLCIGFYSIWCFSRRAYGPLFILFLSHFSVFLLRSELSSQSFARSWCYVVNFLLGSFTRSWCYVVNFLLSVLHALDATLWTFFLEVLHALDATWWTLDKASYLWTLKDLCLNSADCWSRIERQWKKWKERTDGPHWPYIPNMV